MILFKIIEIIVRYAFSTGITTINSTAFVSSRWTFIFAASKWKQISFPSGD